MTKFKLLLPLLLFLCVTQTTLTFENEADLRKKAQEKFFGKTFLIERIACFACTNCKYVSSSPEGASRHKERCLNHGEIKQTHRFVVHVGKNYWLPNNASTGNLIKVFNHFSRSLNKRPKELPEPKELEELEKLAEPTKPEELAGLAGLKELLNSKHPHTIKEKKEIALLAQELQNQLKNPT